MRGDYSFLRPAKDLPQVVAALKVAIAPTPDFTLMSLSCFVEFLRHAADEVDFSRQNYCSWDLLSHDWTPIGSSCGFQMMPTKLFSSPRDYDYVVVHGGILHSGTPVPEALYEFVRRCVEAEVPVVGMCTGQFVLAELGLMVGRRCAVHFSTAEAMKRNFPDVVCVTDAPVVTDGAFITCPGGLASINLARHLVTGACGRTRSDKALHYLMADRGFDEIHALRHDVDDGVLQLSRRVADAVGLMRQRMFETVPIAEIARDAGTTERELTRLFRKYLNASPLGYWRGMRLKAARWMVLNSDRSTTQIAHECGFTDSSHLIHWFKRNYGTTPAKMRRAHVEIGAR